MRAHVAVQLGLDELEKREVTIANGEHVVVPYAGPVRVGFANRSCYAGALVLGKGVLLGSIPLEDMDLGVNPRPQTITVNPESPNIPSVVVKPTHLPSCQKKPRTPCRSSNTT